MAVNKLTRDTKNAIIEEYKNTVVKVTHLAQKYNTSTRTIGRVLVEAGLATPVPRLQGNAYMAMKMLQTYGVDIDELHRRLSSYKQETHDHLVASCAKLNDSDWSKLLNEIVTARIAKASNTHVQSAMLRIEEKVKRNERDNKANK